MRNLLEILEGASHMCGTCSYPEPEFKRLTTIRAHQVRSRGTHTPEPIGDGDHDAEYWFKETQTSNQHRRRQVHYALLTRILASLHDDLV